MNHDHEHDEDGAEEYEVALPHWKFSLWDVAGIALHGTQGVLMNLGQAAGLLARECAAAANYSRGEFETKRYQKEQEAAQRAIGEDLRALIEGDQ